MKETFKYHELDREAQGRALVQANQRHPLESRNDTLDKILAVYSYDKDGWILYGTGEGQDPEYYEDMLN